MARKRTEALHVRLSKGELKTLGLIREDAGLEDSSESVRFCISFTKTMLSIVPAAAGEALIEMLEENAFGKEASVDVSSDPDV